MLYKNLYNDNSIGLTYEDIEEIFQYHRRVWFFNDFGEDRIDVLILKPDFQVSGNLPHMPNLNGPVFELHMIVT